MTCVHASSSDAMTMPMAADVRDDDEALRDETLDARPDLVALLVAEHRSFLAFLERRLRDRALAEDVLQDAFVKGLVKGGELRDDEAVVAWFYRMLRNAVVDHHRRGVVRSRALEELAAELELAAPGAETARTICACVGELAGTLKPEYAEAIRVVEIDGIPVKDYAARTGISPSNAGVRIFRARAALRERVRAACGTCATHGCVDCTCEQRPTS